MSPALVMQALTVQIGSCQCTTASVPEITFSINFTNDGQSFVETRTFQLQRMLS